MTVHADKHRCSPRRFPNRNANTRTVMPAIIVTFAQLNNLNTISLSLYLALSSLSRSPLSLFVSGFGIALCVSLWCYSRQYNPSSWMRILVLGIRSVSMGWTSLPSVSTLICHDVCCQRARTRNFLFCFNATAQDSTSVCRMLSAAGCCKLGGH